MAASDETALVPVIPTIGDFFHGAAPSLGADIIAFLHGRLSAILVVSYFVALVIGFVIALRSRRGLLTRFSFVLLLPFLLTALTYAPVYIAVKINHYYMLPGFGMNVLIGLAVFALRDKPSVTGGLRWLVTGWCFFLYALLLPFAFNFLSYDILDTGALPRVEAAAAPVAAPAAPAPQLNYTPAPQGYFDKALSDAAETK